MTYEELKECDNTDKREEVGECSHNGSKLGPSLEHRAQQQRYEEQRQ